MLMNGVPLSDDLHQNTEPVDDVASNEVGYSSSSGSSESYCLGPLGVTFC